MTAVGRGDSLPAAVFLIVPIVIKGVVIMAAFGDIILLGSYPQEGPDFTRREPIQWIILDEKEGQLLCISRYLLDARPYHPTHQMVTWATCGLREWLNREFFRTAFTLEEQERILTTHLQNSRDYPEYDTDDKIFLLDHTQAVDYFESEDHPMTRSATTTAYARSRRAWFLSAEEADGEDDPLLWAGCWWLRCPEYIPKDNPDGLFDVLSCVNFDDYIEVYAAEVEETDCCIRPALWLRG